MYCYKCGKENSDGSKFCYSCGAELDKKINKEEISTDTKKEHENHSQNSSKDKQLIIGIILVVVCAIIGYFKFFRTITIQNANVGDVVVFGMYYRRIPIRWRVLEVKPYKKLLLSERGIGCTYSTQHDNNWEKSGARDYLNSSFYNFSFSESEKLKIESAWNKVEYGSYDIPKGFRNPDKATLDKVFLLNKDEVVKYLKNDSDRLCKPIEYNSNLWINEKTGTCDWLLRSPGKAKGYVSCVSSAGSLNSDGFPAGWYTLLRPAVWVIVEE